MALNVGTQRLTLLARARDQYGTANSAFMIWDLFNRLQWAVNAQIEDVVASTSLTLNVKQCVYGINALIPDALKITGVRDGNKDLYPMKFDGLRGLDRYWFRRFKDYLKWFALCGYDLLIVGPPQETLQEATTANIFYQKKTAAITSDGSNFELQDENVQSVMELAEAILLAKARDWPGSQQALQRALKSLNLEHMALRDAQPIVQPTTVVEE